MNVLRRPAVSAMIVALAVMTGSARPATASQTITRAASSGQAPSGNTAMMRGCPAPKTCGLYRLENYRWPTNRGIATISYVVNPWQPWLGRERAIDAIAAAARAWSSAHAAIRFVSKGTTPRQPVLGDSINEVAWGRIQTGALAVANVRIARGKVAEADIVLNVVIPWTWNSCAQRDGACSTADADAGMIQRFDVQSILTHEFGHWLGLAHLGQSGASELSMFTTPNPGDRKQITLALGDVRGIRAAYPCRSCRMPRIVSP